MKKMAKIDIVKHEFKVFRNFFLFLIGFCLLFTLVSVGYMSHNLEKEFGSQEKVVGTSSSPSFISLAESQGFKLDCIEFENKTFYFPETSSIFNFCVDNYCNGSTKDLWSRMARNSCVVFPDDKNTTINFDSNDAKDSTQQYWCYVAIMKTMSYDYPNSCWKDCFYKMEQHKTVKQVCRKEALVRIYQDFKEE
jgi:hypothetical protein